MADIVARGLAQKALGSLTGINQSVSMLEEDRISISDALNLIVIRGIATDGLNGFLEDTTKNWTPDFLAGKTLKVTIENIDYFFVITSNTATKINFNPLAPPSGATAGLGSGEEGQGRVVLTLKGALLGTIGNDYSIQVINGDTDTGVDTITLDATNKLFTIYVDSDASGNPRQLQAGSIEAAILANPEVDAVLQMPTEFTTGYIPATDEPVGFAGGDDGIYVSAGDSYEIAFSVKIDNLEEQIAAMSDNTSAGYFDIGNMRIQFGKSQLVAGSATINFHADFKDTNYSFTSSVCYVPDGSVVYLNNGDRTTSSVVVTGLIAADGTWSPSGDYFDWIAIGLIQ
jgi:hypothetical protein